MLLHSLPCLSCHKEWFLSVGQAPMPSKIFHVCSMYLSLFCTPENTAKFHWHSVVLIFFNHLGLWISLLMFQLDSFACSERKRCYTQPYSTLESLSTFKCRHRFGLSRLEVPQNPAYSLPRSCNRCFVVLDESKVIWQLIRSLSYFFFHNIMMFVWVRFSARVYISSFPHNRASETHLPQTSCHF